MSFVVTLADAADAGTVGGKAASLGELARAGVSVPPGFAVTSHCALVLFALPILSRSTSMAISLFTTL